jgi:hypothetical protein
MKESLLVKERFNFRPELNETFQFTFHSIKKNMMMYRDVAVLGFLFTLNPSCRLILEGSHSQYADGRVLEVELPQNCMYTKSTASK